jgi:RimJ/RimL family protein N-acetyltransferase
MAGLAPYREIDEDETLAYLARRPYDNAYVAWLLRTKQIGKRDDAVVWREPSGAIGGFALVASRIVPCADSSEAARAFAAHAATRVRDPRLIVGPKDAMDAFWESARGAMPRPFAVRACQPVFVIGRGGVRATAASTVDARIADAREVDELASASADMTTGEVGYRVIADAAFRKRTGRIVAAGWYWRYRVAGKLAFMCHIGAETEHTAQIQGVWTPPEMRGHGHAARALATISATLLEKYPTLSLYVNDFNAAAIALYERVGFTRTGTLSTIIFA